MPQEAGPTRDLTTNSSKTLSADDYKAAGVVWARFLTESARHNPHRNGPRTKVPSAEGQQTRTEKRVDVQRVNIPTNLPKFSPSPFPEPNQLRAKAESGHSITGRPVFSVSAADTKSNPSANPSANPFRPKLGQQEASTQFWMQGVKSEELAGKRIVIDAGHGGADCGAKYGGVYEKDINLEMAKLVADGLRRRGAEVIMTRDSDKAVELGARYQLTRQVHPDAFLSIHCNASPRGEDQSAYGMQTHFYAPKSAQYARAVSTSLSKLSDSWLTINNRGTFDSENSDFYVLKNQNIPSALVELGFVSNRKERNLLSDPAYRQQLADALIKAEVNYFTQPAPTRPGLRYVENTPAPKPKASYHEREEAGAKNS